MNRTLPRSPGAKLIGGAALALVAIAGFLLVSLGGGQHSLAGSPRLVIGPNPASPGSTVSVTGFNYPSSRGVEIYFQSPSLGLVKAMTNAEGFFIASFKLPRSLSAASRVYAVSGGTIANVVVQVMKPSLFASVTASSFAVSGRGFVAGEPVALTLEGKNSSTPEGTILANEEGGFTFQATLPGTATRDTLIATDLDKNMASVSLALAPTLNLAPPQGVRGTHVMINGGGYVRGELVIISFQGFVVARTRAFANGHILTGFFVPFNALAGKTVVVAQGSSGSNATATFTVLSPFLVFPRVGRPGTTVFAAGGSFTPRGQVRIDLICLDVSCAAIPIKNITAAGNGTINTFFQIPRRTVPGRYSIIFIDVQSGNVISVPFNVIR